MDCIYCMNVTECMHTCVLLCKALEILLFCVLYT